jgi:hypothetical protein
LIDFGNPEREDFRRNARELNAVSLTSMMLALLVTCYAVCGAVVLFAEHVIRPRSAENADAADLRGSNAQQQTRSL